MKIAIQIVVVKPEQEIKKTENNLVRAKSGACSEGFLEVAIES